MCYQPTNIGRHTFTKVSVFEEVFTIRASSTPYCLAKLHFTFCNNPMKQWLSDCSNSEKKFLKNCTSDFDLEIY